MLFLIAKRLLLIVVVLAGMSVITFGLTRIIPGDPARLLAGPEARAEQVEALRRQYGLDKPVVTQYVDYMGGLFHGDFGQSLTTRRSVAQDFAEFVPATLELTAAALLLIVFIGIPLGFLSARHPNGILDHLSRILTIAGMSMPVFWLGVLFQIVFFKWLGILPSGGRLGIIESAPPQVTGLYTVDSLLAGDFGLFKSAVVHLVLPAFTLALASLATITRVSRATVIGVLRTDYVRTAYARGLSERQVMTRHVLKNAMIPTVTVLGMQIGILLGGNLIVEAVFSWPGIGLYAVNAIKNLDFAPIMGVMLISAVAYVTVNLIVDLVYLLLNPRITYAREPA